MTEETVDITLSVSDCRSVLKILDIVAEQHSIDGDIDEADVAKTLTALRETIEQQLDVAVNPEQSSNQFQS